MLSPKVVNKLEVRPTAFALQPCEFVRSEMLVGSNQAAA